MITLQHYLVLSAILFTIGAVGVVTRRDVLVIIISVYVMISAAVLAVLTFARWNLLPEGKVLALFMIAIAASQLIVGVLVIVVLRRRKESTDIDVLKSLKG